MTRKQYITLRQVWFSIARLAFDALKDKQGNLKAIDTAFDKATDLTRSVAQQLGMQSSDIDSLINLFKENHLHYGDDVLWYPIILGRRYRGKPFRRISRKAYPLPR